MNITLKNLKVHKDMSEETLCFSASIYLDGKKVGTASNQGCGGPHNIYWTDKDAGKKIDAWAKKQDMRFNFDHTEQIIDKLIDDIEEKKCLKRWTKNKIVFRLKGDEEGSWRTINIPWHEKHRAGMEKKYGKDKIERIANEEI